MYIQEIDLEKQAPVYTIEICIWNDVDLRI